MISDCMDTDNIGHDDDYAHAPIGQAASSPRSKPEEIDSSYEKTPEMQSTSPRSSSKETNQKGGKRALAIDPLEKESKEIRVHQKQKKDPLARLKKYIRHTGLGIPQIPKLIVDHLEAILKHVDSINCLEDPLLVLGYNEGAFPVALPGGVFVRQDTHGAQGSKVDLVNYITNMPGGATQVAGSDFLLHFPNFHVLAARMRSGAPFPAWARRQAGIPDVASALIVIKVGARQIDWDKIDLFEL